MCPSAPTLLPGQEARRLWADAMNDVFKGPSPTGPGQEAYRDCFDARLSYLHPFFKL